MEVIRRQSFWGPTKAVKGDSPAILGSCQVYNMPSSSPLQGLCACWPTTWWALPTTHSMLCLKHRSLRRLFLAHSGMVLALCLISAQPPPSPALMTAVQLSSSNFPSGMPTPGGQELLPLYDYFPQHPQQKVVHSRCSVFNKQTTNCKVGCVCVWASLVWGKSRYRGGSDL